MYAPARARLGWGRRSAAPVAPRGLGENPNEQGRLPWNPRAPMSEPRLVGLAWQTWGLGQDIYTPADLAVQGQPDVVAFDPTLPHTDRPVSSMLINRGCPVGYFAQLVGPGEPGAVQVPRIPGVTVGPEWFRCRLAASSTAGTITSETGTTWREQLSVYQDAVQDTVRQVGERAEKAFAWAPYVLGAAAVIVGGLVVLRYLPAPARS